MHQKLRIFLILVLTSLMITTSLWQLVNKRVSVSTTRRRKHTYRTNVSYKYPMNELGEDDYHRLIDLDDFKFIKCDEICKNIDPILLVLVHSAPKNVRRRNTIRETWGQYRDGMRTVFMLGYSENQTVENMLLEENRKHGDFVQGNFVDSYKNITYKHIMVFKYAIYHCPQAKYILKIDDDVFINVYTLMMVLKEMFSPNGCSNLLLCKIARKKTVFRTNQSKWRVSVKEYAFDSYPVYCPGFVVLYSQDVVFTLYKEAQKGDYFWIDDVHVTGTLAQRTNITHTDLKPYLLRHGFVESASYYKGNFLYSHEDLDDDQMRILWAYLFNYTSKRFL